MKENVKDFVEIQSTTTINVTKGLQFSDYTNPNAPIANKLNVKPRWTKTIILIKEGKHIYPSEIIEWESVKSLEKSGILTIGKFVDGDENAIKEKNRLDKAEKELEKTTTKKLSDLGGN